MRLTKRGEYGLRTMIRLGVAARMGQAVQSVSQLAEQERLPFKFLEQILAELRLAGYVESVRGKHGGAKLARPADKITMGEIVRLIDGKLAPIGCASETEYEPCSCPDEAHCGLRMLMIDVRNAIANILDRYTLAQVVDVTIRKLERDNVPLPFAKVEAKDAPQRVAVGVGPRRSDPADGFLALLTDPAKLFAESRE